MTLQIYLKYGNYTTMNKKSFTLKHLQSNKVGGFKTDNNSEKESG